ncbi:MAG: NADH-quinone oxidoreductase subunit M [Blastocatellia bacterium]
MNSILHLTILLPLLGAIAVGLLGSGKNEDSGADNRARMLTLAVTIINFLVSLGLLAGFDAANAGPQLTTRLSWIPALGVSYFVGIDGISLWLALLTTFTMPIAILASWHIHKLVAPYMVFMLILESGMLGVFYALDMFLFYLFFEITLIPMYFLIGVWGGERRIYAAIKFFIYTVVGSLLMLVAIIAVYQYAGGDTFDIVEITRRLATKQAVIPANIQFWLWAAFALAFFIKVPLWPLHTWLPDAHVEAPTGGSIVLAAVLLKMGTYGLMRFNLPFFPEVSRQAASWVLVLCVIGIIYGALVAMVQPDMKKLVAYSSVSHMAFVVMGIFSFTQQGMQGALYQMLNHGISTGALFLCVGMIYDRRHTRLIEDFGGVATPMPKYSTMFVIIALSSLGLPLLNGFIGEFLILLGTFNASLVPNARVCAVLGATGVILSAVYLLWMLQRVLFGETTKKENQELEDMEPREHAALIPLVAMAIIMGVAPMLFLNKSDKSVNAVRTLVTGGGTEKVAQQ